MRKLIWVVWVSLLLVPLARADLFLYEGFDYGKVQTPLAALDGGTNFTSPWAVNSNVNSRDADYYPNNGLTYGELQTVGGAAYTDLGVTGTTSWSGPDPHKWDSLNRTFSAGGLPMADGDSLWVSYLVDMLNPAIYQTFGRWAGIKFESADLWFGRNATQNNWGMEMPGGIESPIAITSGTKLLVLKVEYVGVNENKYLWVNPGTNTLGGADLAVGTADLAITGTARKVFSGTLLFEFTVEAFVDEIRVGEFYADVTPIPEPASILLMLSGIASAYSLRRRS